jgi:hypothetical protein
MVLSTVRMKMTVVVTMVMASCKGIQTKDAHRESKSVEGIIQHKSVEGIIQHHV